MRTAAGVILIIAAVFNLFAGLAYLGGGAAVTGLGQAAVTGLDQAAIYAEKEGQQLTKEQKESIDKAQDQMSGSGMGWMAFGIFLLASVGILIAGAVFLFQNKKAQFILIAGGMAILAEIIGILITSFGLTNIIGIVGGVLAIIAAKAMGTGSAPDPEPEPTE